MARASESPVQGPARVVLHGARAGRCHRGVKSAGDVRLGHDVVGRDPHQQLAGNRVAPTVFLGPLCTHVAAGDPGGPLQQRPRILGDLSSPVDNHEGVRWRLVVDAQTHPRSRRRALPFSVSAPVVKTTVPSSSRSNQTGATWGRPSARVVANFPVRVPSVRNRWYSASSMTCMAAHHLISRRLSPRHGRARSRWRCRRHPDQMPPTNNHFDTRMRLERRMNATEQAIEGQLTSRKFRRRLRPPREDGRGTRLEELPRVTQTPSARGRPHTMAAEGVAVGNSHSRLTTRDAISGLQRLWLAVADRLCPVEALALRDDHVLGVFG
jgi:hypothetical protein